MGVVLRVRMDNGYGAMMRLSRRGFLSSMAMVAGAAALPTYARAEENDSILDTFARNRMLREADPTGNTAKALEAVETPEPVLSYDTTYNTQLAITQYEQIVAAGGWPAMPREAFNLQLGHSRQAVVSLKRRLIASGDLAFKKAVDDDFNDEVDAALRLFQARHGLLITGKVDELTLHSLAVPADFRLQQLRLNALRLQYITPAIDSERYVVVNIPAATIEAVDLGTVAQRHTAVVGRIERPTPILDSKIHQINFNPYWNVPKSIIQRDLIKYMNEDPEYLTKWKIHIYDQRGNEIMPNEVDWSTDEAVQYQFRQEPGAENSMGHVKINFRNPHAVYLHDTPQKALFGENSRFYSSGCVRVEGADQLVAWLLRDNGGWDLNTVQAAFASNERLDVDVNNPVPIHMTYISAWANRQGTVSFRSDVYDFDEFGRVTFEAA